MRVAAAFLFPLVCVNTVLLSMYSYFRKGCHEAYAPIPLGDFGRVHLGTHRATTFSELAV